MNIQTSPKHEEQTNPSELQKFIADPKISVYVSASAGTGKTKVLVDRFITLMLTNAEPENILCLTFTNFAAKEMASRIKSKLLEISQTPKEKLKQTLQSFANFEITAEHLNLAPKLLDKFLDVQHKLNIQTIHSLCNNILVKYHLENDLRKTVQIIDINQKSEIIKKSIISVLENSAKDEALEFAINQLTTLYDLGWLEKIANQVVSNKQSFLLTLNKNGSLGKLIENLYITLQADYGITSEEYLSNYLEGKKVWYNNLQQRLSTYEDAEIENYLANLKNFLEESTPLSEKKGYIDLFITTDNTPRKRLLKAATAKLYPDLLELLLQEQASIVDLNEALNRQLHAETNVSFWIFANAILNEYNKIKGENVYDYDDLLLQTLEILQNHHGKTHWLLYYLDLKFNHIMVDEAQDLSQVQWEIIKIIGEEFYTGVSANPFNRTIMIVGDFKQSIYSFQGAHPDSFLEINNYFKSLVEAAGKDWRNIELNTSFRTTAPVLNVVDKFFEQNSLFHNKSFEYSIAHNAFREGGGIVAKFPIIPKEKREEKSDEWKIPNKHQKDIVESENILAQKIVSTIAEWLKNKRLLAGHNRVIESKDILILIRKRGSIQNALIKELKAHNINVVSQQSSFLKEQLAVMDLLSFLRFFIMPKDNLNLVNLLKSPFFRLNEKQIQELCLTKGSVIQELQVKYVAIFNQLREYKNYFTTNGLFAFYIKLLEHDGYRKKIIGELGQQNSELLNYFLEICLKYENENSSSALGFLNYIETSDSCFEGEQIQNNAVRIMTAHAAKGLQAPVVIIADAASTEQTPNELYYKYKDQIIFSTPFGNYDVFNNIKKEYNLQQSAEGLRLLYVAMTRAEDELYLCGWENSKMEKSWYSKLQPYLHECLFHEYSGNRVIEKDKAKLDVELPKFLNSPLAPNEKNLISFITGYSKEQETSSVKKFQYKRGELIHKLLYLITHIPQNELDEYCSSFLQANSKDLTASDIQNVLAVVKKFPELFYAQREEKVFSELAISANVKGNIYSLQIDKLIIDELNIKIIEFKSEQKPPKSAASVNKDYLKQLQLYRQAVEKIYPEHIVQTFILWVNTQELMEV